MSAASARSSRRSGALSNSKATRWTRAAQLRVPGFRHGGVVLRHQQQGPGSSPRRSLQRQQQFLARPGEPVLAGGIGDHFGGFSQWTYDGIGRAFSWDNLDLRAIDHVTIYGSDVLLGLSFNNNPGGRGRVEHAAGLGLSLHHKRLAPAPAASTIFDGGLAQSVSAPPPTPIGIRVSIPKSGFYWTPSHGFLSAMGTDLGRRPDLGRRALCPPCLSEGLRRPEFRDRRFGFFPDLYPAAT